MSLWEQYINNELPHIHNSGNELQDIFEDALVIQGKRIKNNLKKAYPEMSYSQIHKIMFGAENEEV